MRGLALDHGRHGAPCVENPLGLGPRVARPHVQSRKVPRVRCACGHCCAAHTVHETTSHTTLDAFVYTYLPKYRTLVNEKENVDRMLSREADCRVEIRVKSCATELPRYNRESPLKSPQRIRCRARPPGHPALFSPTPAPGSHRRPSRPRQSPA